MPTEPNPYLTLMRSAITSTDGTLVASFTQFEALLVTTAEARLVSGTASSRASGRCRLKDTTSKRGGCSTMNRLSWPLRRTVVNQAHPQHPARAIPTPRNQQTPEKLRSRRGPRTICRPSTART